MNTFEESDLQITFPESWLVRKYDETTAYHSVSGHGLKGVDFLCLAPDGRLWLVEVKNYRRREERHKTHRRNPEALAEHVGRKFVDTKRLIRVVNRAMRRNWWIGLQLLWYDLRKIDRPRSHYWFWAEAERRLANPRKLVCLLWLETPELNPDYEAATAEALEEWLEPGNELKLAETQRPAGVPVTVIRKQN
ncbi:hypothetical protein [Neolewinella litorea]|uniref:NERD domain-containing protein n=1 Tax=Neolewinella litorea TaxID=2562452 RepID=A0A4V3XLR3_9BACT|nr:hypothetical protein [Neolewinella litorea]THH41633.1 hypothetical protein E4021_03295 [Neolewinella litorea]